MILEQTSMVEEKRDWTSIGSELAGLDEDTRRIAKLTDVAVKAPEKRKRITGLLEQYAQKFRGMKKGGAATKAIAIIATVTMLETLQGGE